MVKKAQRVLVTGGSGFIGLHVVKQLLESGYCVNTTTRSLASKSAAPLKELAVQYPNKLLVFEADLLEKGSYTESMREADAVFHLATPVMAHSGDEYQDQIRPAVEGTRNVLETCLDFPAVKTVVLTSSAFTVIGTTPKPNHSYTEDDFNEPSLESEMAYVVAKVQAEKFAICFSQLHQDKFRLVCLNPVFVFGPEILAKGATAAQSRSNLGRDMALAYLCGIHKQIPPGGIPTVDVRDVAFSHVLALETDSLEGRVLIHGAMTKWSEMAAILSECSTNSNVPAESLPSDEPWFNVENTKSVIKLGMEYIPIAKSLQDMVAQMPDFN